MGEAARLVESEHALQVVVIGDRALRQIPPSPLAQIRQLLRLLLQRARQLPLPLGDLQQAHRQGGFAGLICADDVQQITAHQPILGIGVEIGIALAVGRSAGDCPLAIEIEVGGHQAGVTGGQPAQPCPAGTDRLAAEQIQPDSPHADPIQPFDCFSQQPISNHRSIALEIVLVDADDAHGGGGPGGQGPELHR